MKIKANLNYIPDDFTCCVSGGVDSIAAAHFLKFKRYKTFKIIHFNHKLQESNVEMVRRVVDFSKEYNFDMILRERPDSWDDLTEKGLREWRLYEMSLIGGDFVTGHHLNDATEQYLMNCLHGTPEYMPIKWRTDFGKHKVSHPFLNTTKKSIENYIDEEHLCRYVVSDPSNNNNKYKRNWIRNVIIPEIELRSMGLEKIVRKKFYLS
jgi:tRNA(Ile)-lysidine synthase